jgi:hypothetical protein
MILSASELKASREAQEAGVSGVSEDDAERAIAVAEATLNRSLGYKVANAATTITFVTRSDMSVMSPERIRTITSISESIYGDASSNVSDYYELRGDGFTLWRRTRWRDDAIVTVTGAFGFDTTDDEYVLAQHFVLLLAVRLLQRSSVTAANGFPAPAGAVLTGFSSESAQFSFFTPTGETTGYADLDAMLDQIGKHPNRKSGLWTLSLTSGERDVTFDDIVAGRAEFPYG